MIKLKISYMFAFSLVLITCVYAVKKTTTMANGTRTTLRQSKAYCDDLDLYSFNLTARRVFLQDAPKKAWRERKTQRDEPKLPYREASVWFRNNSPVIAMISNGRPDRTWEGIVKLYFRTDGTLVKSTYTSTPKGNHPIMSQIEYFDPQGRSIWKRTGGMDKRTLKSVKVGKTSVKVPLYRTISALPFFNLLPATQGKLRKAK